MEKYLLKDDGTIPNNEKVPLLVYGSPIELDDDDPAATFEKRFAENGWTASWRNGIYDFHHYHSTAHEVLGIYRGKARVLLGGNDGVTLEIKAGDVLVIPAGVAHKNLDAHNLGVVGAYDRGRKWDMNYGSGQEREKTLENISRVPKPDKDPVYGDRGPLIDAW